MKRAPCLGRLALVGACLAGAVGRLMAQDSTATGAPAFRWHPARDAAVLAGVAGGAWAISAFDVRWATALQRPRFQDNVALRRSASVARVAGDPGALALTTGVLVAGWVTRRPGLADAGRHATEAVVASGLVTAALKVVAGRSRPYVVHDSDAGAFDVFGGLRRGRTSMPSGHTSVAFAAAAAFSSELGRSHPRAARIARPLMYLGAASVGFSRMYNDRHWASDVVVSAGIGTFVGRRLVTIAHRPPRRRLTPVPGQY